MKKIILVIICILLSGCAKKETVDSKSNILYQQYKEYEKVFMQQQDYQDHSDEFEIRLVVNKINDEKNRYDIIIDSPKINMYHLQAIAKVKQDDNESLPTLGILEDEVFSLVPNVLDKSKGFYKGVNLSGITKEKKFDVLVYLTFYNNENDKNKETRFITLYGDATR